MGTFLNTDNFAYCVNNNFYIWRTSTSMKARYGSLRNPYIGRLRIGWLFRKNGG